MKKIFGISLSLLLIINLIGKPVLEFYQEEVRSSFEEETVFFEENDNELLVKMHFHLPYQSTSYDFDVVEDVIIYKGNFYRTSKRVFENDTLYTTLKKEVLDRSNILEMVSQVSKNYDKKPVDPVQHVIDLLKNFSNSYHTVSVAYYTFFWVDYVKFSHSDPVSFYDSLLGHITSPPPRC